MAAALRGLIQLAMERAGSQSPREHTIPEHEEPTQQGVERAFRGQRATAAGERSVERERGEAKLAAVAIAKITSAASSALRPC